MYPAHTQLVAKCSSPSIGDQRATGCKSKVKILTKIQLRNLNQTSAAKYWPNFSTLNKSKVKILTKPSFKILTKIQLHNLNQTSAAKYWPNFSFKIPPELQLQNLDQRAQSLNTS